MRFLSVFLMVSLFSFAARADITIAMATPLTGPIASIGEQIRWGTEQAIEDINASGGINGVKLALQEKDDACDPRQAVVVANQIASSGIKFVLGHACSGPSIAAAKIYAEENILMITSTSTDPGLTEAGLVNVFRTCGRDDQEGVVQADYVLKHFRDRRVAIIHDDSAVGLNLSEQFKKYLNAGGMTEVLYDSYVQGEKDFSALLGKLKKNDIQVLVIGGFHTETGLIARQLKERNMKIVLMSDDALATSEFWSIAGDAGEGLLFSFLPDVSKRPAVKTVIERMQKAGRGAEGFSFYSYAAIQVIAEGIRRAGQDPANVAAAIRQTPVETILGPLSFNPKGDVSGRTYVMYRWHNGKYEEVGS